MEVVSGNKKYSASFEDNNLILYYQGRQVSSLKWRGLPIDKVFINSDGSRVTISAANFEIPGLFQRDKDSTPLSERRSAMMEWKTKSSGPERLKYSTFLAKFNFCRGCGIEINKKEKLCPECADEYEEKKRLKEILDKSENINDFLVSGEQIITCIDINEHIKFYVTNKRLINWYEAGQSKMRKLLKGKTRIKDEFDLESLARVDYTRFETVLRGTEYGLIFNGYNGISRLWIGLESNLSKVFDILENREHFNCEIGGEINRFSDLTLKDERVLLNLILRGHSSPVKWVSSNLDNIEHFEKEPSENYTKLVYFTNRRIFLVYKPTFPIESIPYESIINVHEEPHKLKLSINGQKSSLVLRDFKNRHDYDRALSIIENQRFKKRIKQSFQTETIEETEKCPECGTPLQESQDCCEKCGTLSSKYQHLLNSSNWVEVTEEIQKCLQCDNPTQEEAIFCDQCGTPVSKYQDQLNSSIETVIEENRECPLCGTSTKEKANFCGECGTPISK